MINNGLNGIPSNRVIRSSIWAGGQAAYGSASSNKCFTYPTIFSIYGKDIQYMQDTVNGDMFKVAKTGVYFIGVTGGGSSVVPGVSVNSADLTASSNNALTYAQGYRGSAQVAGFFSIMLPLNEGDVVRAQTDGGTIGTSANAIFFTMTLVS